MMNLGYNVFRKVASKWWKNSVTSDKGAGKSAGILAAVIRRFSRDRFTLALDPVALSIF